ncbi:hypothetical protein IKF81_00680 [Candidatus Saccharibacteria bacterium]|nr:hypothetical protein [Candidatus Saccharibacteria bacterium]
MKEKTAPEQSEEKKKSKKPLIISLIIIALVLAAGGASYYFFFRKKSPLILSSESEYLIETKSWEKVDAPSVIWTFNEQGKGEITTNKSNYYEMEWELSDKTLKIDTNWLYELNDSFDFFLNREEKSFTVINRSDNTVSTFVPLGTSVSNAENASPDTSAQNSAE